MIDPSTFRKLASAMCCWAALSAQCLVAADAEDREVRPTVNEILTTWVRHAGLIQSGRLDWEITRHLRSSDFGSSQRAAAGNTASDGMSANRILVSFNEQVYRLETESIPPRELSDLRSGHQYDGFAKALNTKFEDEGPVRVSQRYVVIRDSAKEIHLWHEHGKGYPRSAICRPGESGRYLSSGIATMLFDVLEAALHLQPSSASHDHVDEFSVLDQPQLLHGLPCLVLRQQIEKKSFFEMRRYWVDPEREYLVRRADLTRNGRKACQIDITYRSDDQTPRVPQTVELTQFGEDGGVDDQMVLSLREAKWGDVQPMDFSGKIPAGYLVTDFVRGLQYVAREDGGKRMITQSEVVKGLRYEDISSGGTVKDRSWLWRHIRDSSDWAAWVWWITWPGVIVTLAIACRHIYSSSGHRSARSLREPEPLLPQSYQTAASSPHLEAS